MNASLYGFLEEALPAFEVYGTINGLQGLCEDRLAPLPGPAVRYLRLDGVPGAWLGSGRWPAGREDFRQSVKNLERRGIGGLALIGGNGTMWACMQLEQAARRAGQDLSVVGIPKTVDNDLAETDHAPGFGSAARFVTTLVRDIGKDLEAMRNFEAVRVLETMGRNVGWLAMSAGYLKERPADPPHLIYVPERPFDEDEFLHEVRETHRAHGYVVVVVSEGLTPRDREEGLREPILGGVSRELAQKVNQESGLTTRGELLGMGQRSYASAVPKLDREEARTLGAAAATMLREGRSGAMPALRRVEGPGYAAELTTVPFGKVAGIEKPLPREWVLSPDVVHEGFKRWLEPLVGSDITAYPPNLSEEDGAL